MTPERQKWWDNLPANERALRVALNANRRMLRLDKECLTESKGSVYLAREVRKQKLVIKAIKHELDRTTKKVAYKNYNGLAEYRCEKCGGTIFEVISQSYCCWCGRKIVGCKSNE